LSAFSKRSREMANHEILNNPVVGIYRTETDIAYPRKHPFHPDKRYPEYPFDITGSEPNPVYHAIRELFRILNFDRGSFDTPKWNPLGRFIKPGNTVVLKPNLIKEKHQENNDWEYIITHGSVIRAVVDYAIIALKGSGTIKILDGPQFDSNYREIITKNGLVSMLEFLKGRIGNIDISLVNVQQEFLTVKDEVVVKRKKLPGDPLGYVKIDLENKSEFAGHAGIGHYYGVGYDYREVNSHHNEKHHEYLISKSALACDVFIDLPKMKTHKKAGITCSLKNLVGINGDRNYLPHHTKAGRFEGGDQFPKETLKSRLERSIIGVFDLLMVKSPGLFSPIYRNLKKAGKIVFGDTRNTVRSGNWHGNDTIWRTILDLNKCLLYGTPDGGLNPRIHKRYFSIVDGFIAGDGNGPMSPDPVYSGLLIGGENPVAVDCACARMMGFDYLKIPQLAKAFAVKRLPMIGYPYSMIRIASNANALNGLLSKIQNKHLFQFRPSLGWRKNIKLQDA
jgi:uncharacterized protein (DUF362 family)